MKYNGVTIEPNPTEQFPEMVKIVKTIKRTKELNGKRFVNLEKAKKVVDAYLAEVFIEKTKIQAYKDALKISGADVEIE